MVVLEGDSIRTETESLIFSKQEQPIGINTIKIWKD